MRILLLHIIVFYSTFLLAQTSPSLNSSQIELGLNKLNVLGSVLYIAAHPDDENTRLLAYLASEKHYRTGYLSLTRGDGGQNLIGNEQGELLGLIRTQELLAARRVDGAEQFFTRANDFGYSKNPEETFAIWGKEKILEDVVYVVRQFQPDVIICRFPATGEGGHGHHTASAILAQEAFSAAADPNRFPEQLKHLEVWQAKRLLWNTFQFGGTNTTSEDQFKFDVGLYNPLLGEGYREIAAESRTNHKSQAFGSEKTRGSQLEYFKTIMGEPPETDLMDGVNTTWSRILNTENIQSSTTRIITDYKSRYPSASVKSLIELRTVIQNLNESNWKKPKIKEIETLILACSGLWFEAYATETQYTPAQKFNWKFLAISRSEVSIQLQSVSLQNFDTTFNFSLANNMLMTYNHEQILEATTPITQPYWLQHEHDPGSFTIPDPGLTGKPWNDESVTADFQFIIAGKHFEFVRPLVYKYEDPTRGEVYNPLSIAPAVMVNIEKPVYIFSSGDSKEIKVQLKSAAADETGNIKLNVPGGWSAEPAISGFSLKNKGDEASVVFSITPPSGLINSAVDTLKVIMEMNGKTFNQSIRTIAYDHIPSITIFPSAKARLVSVPVKISGGNIGYIKGAGDLVPQMLEQVGYKVTLLSDDEITPSGLQRFDAVVTGVRAFNTDARLKYLNQTLLNYAKNGGTVLIQYNTNYDMVTEEIGPYPFKISRGRVTDEHSAVSFNDVNDPVLNLPNKLTLKDFDGWIQERGLYFLTDVDSNYRKILTMNDPGEKPLDGSVIVSKYGMGKFVYTSLSFFRELPAGVPGAYRLFVNLISKNE
ncbi:MAG: PIG-L family deacetylase [Chitinophagales bacterium]